MALTQLQQERAHALKNKFGNRQFTAADVSEALNIAVSTARKFLKVLEDECEITLVNDKKQKIYRFVGSSEPAVEPDVEPDSATEESSETRENEYRIMYNGQYVTTVTGCIDEILEEVQAIYPNAVLTASNGNTLLFESRTGTKG